MNNETHICQYCKAETSQPDEKCYANPKKQTAVEWLYEQMFLSPKSIIEYRNILDQAKAMEKQQIELTAIKCHFEGVRQKAKTSEQYIEYGEQYYRETYEL